MAAAKDGDSRGSAVRLPADRPPDPLKAIALRLLLAAGLLLFVAAVVYLDRAGYVDESGDEVTVVGALYYATVTTTTTGYGDIVPVTERSRLLTALLVTPARVGFLILLVSATLETLTTRSRHDLNVRRWRRKVRDHYIICGYGTMGRSATETLRESGVPKDCIVVVDRDDAAVSAATGHGFTTIADDATSRDALRQAGIDGARGVVVCPGRDEASVLISLTARELNDAATVVAAVHERENAHLLRQSGADSVITSSAASGRMLGLASFSPRQAELLRELLAHGEGLEFDERVVDDTEVGGRAKGKRGELVLAVVRNGQILLFDDERCHRLENGDRLLTLRTTSGHGVVEDPARRAPSSTDLPRAGDG